MLKHITCILVQSKPPGAEIAEAKGRRAKRVGSAKLLLCYTCYC